MPVAPVGELRSDRDTVVMVDVELKTALHDELRWVREAMLWKLDGLSEYDVRRPLTATGTNFLGLIKHLSMGESKYGALST